MPEISGSHDAFRDAQVEISVRDSGPGIPAASIDRIFEPLFSTKADGLGMGLGICRTIIDAHGGRLWAERNWREVRFLLPRANETVTRA